ncbi:MAG: PA14 domain-containing protein [Anaerolineales bacterium]|nr:PA14 domain-containing protein [Anaerolineales bacterium]
MRTKFTKSILRHIVIGIVLSVLNLLLAGNLMPANPASAQQPVYNTAFLTDAQLENYNSMNTDQIRTFLSSYNSYFRQPIQDVDGQTFDPPAVIAQTAIQYRVNPKVILATLEKESNGVTRTTRPSDNTMRFLMGCVSPSTARQQITCAAERLRAYHDQLTNTGSTVSGWQVGVPKTTQDGVTVTPATKAVAGQFAYTPYAGVRWGGNQPSVGGVFLFYHAWSRFGFGNSTSCAAGQYRAEYYNDRSLSGSPTFTRCEGSINYDWGGSPGNGVGDDNFSVRWTGRHYFRKGNYTFIARADDGIRVWVDGSLIIDAWRDQAPTEYRAKRSLSAGEHEIKVEFYENSGGAVAQVGWEQASITCPIYRNRSLSGSPTFMQCEN